MRSFLGIINSIFYLLALTFEALTFEAITMTSISPTRKMTKSEAGRLGGHAKHRTKPDTTGNSTVPSASGQEPSREKAKTVKSSKSAATNLVANPTNTPTDNPIAQNFTNEIASEGGGSPLSDPAESDEEEAPLIPVPNYLKDKNGKTWSLSRKRPRAHDEVVDLWNEVQSYLGEVSQNLTDIHFGTKSHFLALGHETLHIDNVTKDLFPSIFKEVAVIRDTPQGHSLPKSQYNRFLENAIANLKAMKNLIERQPPEKKKGSISIPRITSENFQLVAKEASKEATIPISDHIKQLELLLNLKHERVSLSEEIS